jgi:hypothetical protein
MHIINTDRAVGCCNEIKDAFKVNGFPLFKILDIECRQVDLLNTLRDNAFGPESLSHHTV